MGQEGSADWYLEIGGKKTGPFTLAQLQEFLREGKILLQYPITNEQRVTATHLNGQWVTLRDLSTQPNLSSSEAQPTKILPQRPVGSEAKLAPQSSAYAFSPGGPANKLPGAESDPALSLFDALQAARERTTPPPKPAPVNPQAKSHLPIPRIAAALALMAVLGSMVWGTQIILNNNSQPATSAPAENAENPGAPPTPPPPSHVVASHAEQTAPAATLTHRPPPTSFRNPHTNLAPPVAQPIAPPPPPTAAKNESDRDQYHDDRERDDREREDRERESEVNGGHAEPGTPNNDVHIRSSAVSGGAPATPPEEPGNPGGQAPTEPRENPGENSPQGQ